MTDTFAVAYALVRSCHLALYATAGREGAGLRRSVIHFIIGTVVAVSLLVGASFTDGAAQTALWCIAIALDFGAPAVFGDTRWPLVPAHFAERHYLVVILALGESIVALGAGAEVELTAAVVGSAALGIALTAALWWTYYDVVAIVTRRRLEQSTEGRQRMILARDAYSYLHFPMVAGIVLIALGLEETLHHVDDPLDRVHALALLGGTALYLLAHVALRLRTAGTINFQRLVLASLLLAAVPIAVHVASLVALGGMTAVLWLLISYETLFVYDERRYRLRHGLDTEIPIRRS